MTTRWNVHARHVRDTLQFWIGNRVPRRTLTRLFGWFSRIEQPWVRDLSLAVWRATSALDLSDAKHATFKSVHDCFTRELVPGARPFDPDPAIVASPCDAIVGACGAVVDGTAFQAKGSAYRLDELLVSAQLAQRFRDGCYVTLRLTPSMYHRFHAPYACRVRRITYVAGDVWNVHPPALARVERLYCRNERAVIRCELADCGQPIALVPVAAILVASIRLHFLDTLLHLRYRGSDAFLCDVPLRKGEEMGWFEHGSTLLVFAPAGFELHSGVAPGSVVRMGQPLLRLLPQLQPVPADARLTPGCTR